MHKLCWHVDCVYGIDQLLRCDARYQVNIIKTIAVCFTQSRVRMRVVCVCHTFYLWLQKLHGA